MREWNLNLKIRLVGERFFCMLLPFMATSFAVATFRWSISRTIAPIAIPLTAWIGYRYTFYIIAVLAFLSAFLYSVMFQLLQGRKIQVKKAMNE
ncbi:hypothetical protein [Bacillus rhizoplanae]|uniref:hypothetical protein n=1 Tax=Bacillus rhizoplanae TaxID=2880966 RepID=UPI003D1F7C9D